MQGRQGPGYDSWDRSSSGPQAASNGTGKQRAIPQRPPGMTRIEHPPQTSRVNRPQRKAPPAKSWRRRLLLLVVVILACGLLAWGIGYALPNYFIGVGNISGTANTTNDCLLALNSHNTDQTSYDSP